MSNNSEKSKSFHKGKSDRPKGKYNPPKRGVNKLSSSLAGIGAGLLLGSSATIVGGIIGAIAGDSNKEVSRKNGNHKSYKAGHFRGK